MQICSHLPAGERVHYFLQRRVTHTFPTGESKFRKIFQHAAQHIHSLERFHWENRKPAIFYEFGAGWDLAIPLSFYSLGVDYQILIDIRKLLNIELVNSTIRMLQDLSGELGISRIPNRLFALNDGHKWISQLEELYGIRYLAPYDARHTGLPDESVDFITSTNTLEHIPGDDILPIFRECRRILKSDGAMSFIVDYQDHYSYFDKTIGVCNFFKYSPSEWKKFNPALHFQNRLRHRDYCEIAKLSGFIAESKALTETTVSDAKDLEQIPINPCFLEKYNPEELAIRAAHFILYKSGDRCSDPQRAESVVSKCG